jgi:hypothetical protein
MVITNLFFDETDYYVKIDLIDLKDFQSDVITSKKTQCKRKILL